MKAPVVIAPSPPRTQPKPDSSRKTADHHLQTGHHAATGAKGHPSTDPSAFCRQLEGERAKKKSLEDHGNKTGAKGVPAVVPGMHPPTVNPAPPESSSAGKAPAAPRAVNPSPVPPPSEAGHRPGPAMPKSQKTAVHPPAGSAVGVKAASGPKSGARVTATRAASSPVLPDQTVKSAKKAGAAPATAPAPSLAGPSFKGTGPPPAAPVQAQGPAGHAHPVAAAPPPSWKIWAQPAASLSGHRQSSQWVVKPPFSPPFNVVIVQQPQALTAWIQFQAAHGAMAAPLAQHLPELAQRLAVQQGTPMQVNVLVQQGFSYRQSDPEPQREGWAPASRAGVRAARPVAAIRPTAPFAANSGLDYRV